MPGVSGPAEALGANSHRGREANNSACYIQNLIEVFDRCEIVSPLLQWLGHSS
jgi:hypothetical protein